MRRWSNMACSESRMSLVWLSCWAEAFQSSTPYRRGAQHQNLPFCQPSTRMLQIMLHQPLIQNQEMLTGLARHVRLHCGIFHAWWSLDACMSGSWEKWSGSSFSMIFHDIMGLYRSLLTDCIKYIWLRSSTCIDWPFFRRFKGCRLSPFGIDNPSRALNPSKHVKCMHTFVIRRIETTPQYHIHFVVAWWKLKLKAAIKAL